MVDAIKVDGRKKDNRKNGSQKPNNRNGKCSLTVDKEHYDIITSLSHFSDITIGAITQLAIKEYASKYSDDIVEKYYRHIEEQKALKEKYMKDIVIPVAVATPYED